MASRGHYPINHLIVVRDDVLEAYPGIPIALFHAFSESRDRYIEALQRGDIKEPDATDRLYLRILEFGADPLPYGIGPNRKVLEELIMHALVQKILARQVDVESVFAPATLHL